MKISVKRCRDCGAVPFGRTPVKLWPFEGGWRCQGCFGKALTWDESRPEVVRGIESMRDLDLAIASARKSGAHVPKILKRSKNWHSLIEEWSGLAQWAMAHEDRRTFVYYFARATWAWALSQEER